MTTYLIIAALAVWLSAITAYLYVAHRGVQEWAKDTIKEAEKDAVKEAHIEWLYPVWPYSKQHIEKLNELNRRKREQEGDDATHLDN